MKTKAKLPSYAYPDRSPRAGSERDLLASFYGDDRDTITVGIERCEAGQLNIFFSRSGLIETSFSPCELAKVIEVLNCLHDELTPG